MRVTDRWSYERGALELNRARERHSEKIQELSSGQRVTHPWDDPAAAGSAAADDAEVRRAEAMLSALERGQSELDAVDAGLGDVVEVLSRGRELAVQLSNDTYSASERAAAATEVNALLQGALASLNRQVAGRYLFSGYKDDTAPFDATGAYQGDANVRRVEIAPGTWADASVRADVAIKGVGGGVDALATLSALATALTANDAASVRGTLDAFTAAIAQVARARSQAGSQQVVMQTTSSALRVASLGAQERLSKEVDADAFASASGLQAAERALEAALEATARTGRLSLLNKG